MAQCCYIDKHAPKLVFRETCWGEFGKKRMDRKAGHRSTVGVTQCSTATATETFLAQRLSLTVLLLLLLLLDDHNLLGLLVLVCRDTTGHETNVEVDVLVHKDTRGQDKLIECARWCQHKPRTVGQTGCASCRHTCVCFQVCNRAVLQLHQACIARSWNALMVGQPDSLGPTHGASSSPCPS